MIIIVIVPNGYVFYRLTEGGSAVTMSVSIAKVLNLPYDQGVITVSHNVSPFYIIQLYAKYTNSGEQKALLLNPLRIDVG